MSEKNTGGPAFPEQRQQLNDYGQPVGEPRHIGGMTLRDYFAAKAMQGICAHENTWGQNVIGISESAYQMADAMLKAR